MPRNAATPASRIQTISPVDGSVYVERQLASDPEIDATLEKGKSAQKEWKFVPVGERAFAGGWCCRWSSVRTRLEPS
jgi:acyl-CoA reductase-like NAD-dependent aldehyde dehydrogenase